MPKRKSKRGASAKTKNARVKTPKNSDYRLGASRAPTPANAGNVGLGGKTGVTTATARVRKK